MLSPHEVMSAGMMMMLLLKRRMISKRKESVVFVKSLDKIKKYSFVDDESQMMLSAITRKFEDLRINNKKKVDKIISQLIINVKFFVSLLKWKKKVISPFFNHGKSIL